MTRIRHFLAHSHPIIGSFAAAAASLLPVLAMALHEIQATPSGMVDLEALDNSGERGAGLVFIAAPFLFMAAVPVCYAIGRLLLRLGLKRLGSFLAGTASISLILGISAGLLFCSSKRFGLMDDVVMVVTTASVVLVSALPAALCWWLIVAAPLQKTFLPANRNGINDE